jgi:hypothetical protein
MAEIMRRQSLNFAPGSSQLASSGLNEVSSQGAAQFSAPTSLGISSPMETPPAQPSFWFKINAELIIHGSTEPSAKVSISGREIRLNADGSFSFRFALPDGEFQLPVIAVSADQNDERVAELKFTRSTNVRGEIHAHPQDANLKPPVAENL